MTNKEPEDINIISLSDRKKKKEEEQNKVPDSVIEKLEHVLKMAKENKLILLAVSFEHEPEKKESDTEGGTFFYSECSNAYEVLGFIDVMKDTAFDLLFSRGEEE
jgi:hypothetical protein